MKTLPQRAIACLCPCATKHTAGSQTEHLACMLYAPLALFYKETERRHDASIAH